MYRTMSPTKKLLILAAGLAASGLVLAGIGKAMGGYIGFYINRTGFHSVGEQLKEGGVHRLEKTKVEAFENMEVYVDDAEVHIIPSDDFYLEYAMSGYNTKPIYSIENKTLKFSEPSAPGEFTFWGTSPMFLSDNMELETSFVNLYVPEKTVFNSININNDYGNVTFDLLNGKRVSVNAEDGDIDFEGIRADNIEINNEYGEITGNSLVGNEVTIIVSDGAFRCGTLDGKRLTISNEYGDINIDELLSDNAEITMEDGRFNASVQKIGTLRVDNDYGGISISIPDKLEQYDLDLNTEYGTIRLPGIGTISSGSDENMYRSDTGKSKKMVLYSEDGDINIESKEK